MAFLRRALVAGSLMLSACQNNTIELAEDDGTGAEDTASTGSGGDDEGRDDGRDDGRPTTTAPVDTGVDDGGPGIEDGAWLVSVATTLDPSLPFQFLVRVQEIAPGSYELAMQSLSLEVGSTTAPREPVGDVHDFSGLVLGDGAPLQFYTGTIVVPGAANPITGSDVTIDIFFDGAEIGDPYCGAVSGAVLAPIDVSLDGTTFATTRLAATDPASLPVEFLSACP